MLCVLLCFPLWHSTLLRNCHAFFWLVLHTSFCTHLMLVWPKILKLTTHLCTHKYPLNIRSFKHFLKPPISLSFLLSITNPNSVLPLTIHHFLCSLHYESTTSTLLLPVHQQGPPPWNLNMSNTWPGRKFMNQMLKVSWVMKKHRKNASASKDCEVLSTTNLWISNFSAMKAFSSKIVCHIKD